MATQIKKLGILAGGGSLPKHVVEACEEQGIEYCIIGFEEETDVERFNKYKNLHIFKLYSISKILAKLHEEGVTHVTLAGKVRRAELSRLLLDIKGAKLLAMIVKSGLADNSILQTIIKFITKEGFEIVAPEKIATNIVICKGALTKQKPSKAALDDIKTGEKVLKGIAAFDVGQALVIQSGLVLGVEAAEGTDELIKRCGSIRQKEGEKPVLVKVCKPNQDRRVDLPCIGITTIQLAYEFGFAGIAVEAGSTLLLEQAEALSLANKHKIFIVGM